MPVSTRATLAPYYHEKRRKWYPRGTYPERDAAGHVYRKRGFRGHGTNSRSACQALCDQLNRDLEAEATATHDEPVFARAAAVYVSTGGDARFLTDKLLMAIGHHRVDLINDEIVARVAGEIYQNASAATLNRQLHTPIISVLRQASKGRPWKPSITRPRGALKLKPAKSPPDDWFARLQKEAKPQLWAFVLFLTLHGRRPSDAFRRVPEDFDPKAGTVFLETTKNGEALTVRLAAPVLEAILAYNWQAGPGLFGTMTWKNRRNAYRLLRETCERAGAPYFTFHKAGRHKFAKRLLDAGYSLVHVQHAGGWKDSGLVADLYGAFAHDEVAETAKTVGEDWASKLEVRDNVVPLQKKGGTR